MRVLPLLLHLLLGLFDGDFSRAPGDDVQVGDGVDDKEQVHSGDAKQVDQTGHDTPEFLERKKGHD